MLELDGVVKHYRGTGEEVAAIDGVSLQVAPGEIVAVEGPSGSGKTTLLLLISGLLKPDRGSIRFAGREITSLSDDQASDYRFAEVGFIHQTTRLVAHATAVENAARTLVMGRVGRRDAHARARKYLERVGLGDRLEHTPDQLSIGPRQRVAIGRALATQPQLILADEPTGNLDTAASLQTVELLAQIAHEDRDSDERKPCVVLVTHDPEAAALADRRLELRDGTLNESVATA
jgi:putative ABC transport system ATP-binding protein